MSLSFVLIYLNRKLTDACHTKARSRKRTGIIGSTSTSGSYITYASGSFASEKIIEK